MQHFVIYLIGSLLIFSIGCKSSKPERASFPTTRELSEKLRDVQDPRKYWIKVYLEEDGPHFVDANRVHMSQAVEAPFASGGKSLTPMVELAIRRNQDFVALIDTLSEKNWIDYHHASESGVLTLGPEPYYVQPKHVKDTLESYIGLLTKIRIDKLHMESVIINVRPQNLTLGPLARNIDRPAPDVVLGHDFLKPFSFVQFDFPETVTRFDTSTPYKTLKPNLIAALDFEYGAHGITVKGILEHYRGDIAIDLVGDYGLAIPYPERPVETELILGDYAQRQISVVDSVSLGFGADSIPSIGNQMLRDFLVTIDNRQKKIYFELP